MVIHEEKRLPVWNVVLILAVTFVLIYPFWDIGLRDLFWDEGDYAAIAAEISSFPPATIAHGKLMPYYFPLYPLLVKGLTLLGLSMEFSLRIIPVAALAVMSTIIGFICYRMAGISAAAAGSAIMFSTILTAEKAIEGYPHMLTVLLIFSGWLLWFYFGQIRTSWNTAWLTAGLFSGLAFYNSGWSALVFYFVPMAFLGRPFTLWRRLNKSGFFAGALILFIFILLWLVPRWSLGFLTDNPFTVGGSFLEYFKQAAATPIDAAIRFLPWTFFLYAPFCSALIVIDKNPLFTKYMRNLFLVSAVLLILNPSSRGRDILFLAPTFAVLSGLNYDIVVRRHGNMLCVLMRWASAAMFFIASGAFLFNLFPVSTLRQLFFLKDVYLAARTGVPSLTNLFEALIAITCAAAAYLLSFRKRSVWLIILLFFTSLMLCFWSVVNPYRGSQRSRSETGLAFRKALGSAWDKETVLYKDAAIQGLYTECYYLGARVKTIPFSATAPLRDKELFLLSVSSIQPPDTSRTWVKALDIIYKNQNLYIWKGTLNERKDGQEDDIRNMRF